MLAVIVIGLPVPRSNGSLQHADDPLGDLLRSALDQHDELVAAEAADRVGLAQDVADPGRDDAQQLVADRMAEGVVDALEAVEVDEHRGRLGAGVARVGEHLLGAIHDQRAVGEAGERVVQRLVAELAGLLLDHPQRAGAAAGQHLHEHEGEQAEREPDARARAAPGPRGRRAPRARRAVTVTVQRPSASTEMRLVSALPAARSRSARPTVAACVSESVRNAAPAPVGTRYSGSRRARARASRRRPSGGRPTTRRIGSASNRPMIQPVAPARRAFERARDAAAAVDRRDDLEHLVAVAGRDDERAELAGVARVAEQLGELAEVEARDGQLAERVGHAGAGDAEPRQAVVRRARRAGRRRAARSRTIST